jgi:ATP-dependent protease HslVU (ClpYQ) peptidase subunit
VKPVKTAVVMERLGKRASLATDTLATIEELLVAVFSTRSVPTLYKEKILAAVKHTTAQVTRLPL